MPTAKEYLSDRFWKGERWVSFEVPMEGLEMKDLHCFSAYGAAAWLAGVKSKYGKLYKVREVGEVLQSMKGEPAARHDKEILRKVLGDFPVEIKESTLFLLAQGQYGAISWRKWINPLTAIQSYHVTSGSKLECTFDSLQDALVTCQQLAKRYDTVSLTGNTGYASITLYNSFNGELVEQNDPSEMLPIAIGLFTKFNQGKQQLDFYNGRLRKINPAEADEDNDLSYFYEA